MARNNLCLLALLGCLCAAAVRAETTLSSIDWMQVPAASGATGVAALTQDAAKGRILRITHSSAGPMLVPLLVIEQPAITGSRYALRGEIRYQGVAAGSFLEMWSHFPDGKYFSRTLGTSGPMMMLSGDSRWRPFLLPFQNREGGPAPQRLVINLALQGAGTVDIASSRLIQFDATEDPFAAATGAWWSERSAGLLGGALGGLLGMLGAVIGVLTSTGRAKGLVLGILRLFAIAGTGSLLAALIALLRNQPYAVYYPLLLIGLLAAWFGFLLPRTINKRYQELELRRMRAMDA